MKSHVRDDGEVKEERGGSEEGGKGGSEGEVVD